MGWPYVFLCCLGYYSMLSMLLIISPHTANLLFGPYNWNGVEGVDMEYCSWDGPSLRNCAFHFYEQGLIYLARQSGAEIWPSIGGWSLSDPCKYLCIIQYIILELQFQSKFCTRQSSCYGKESRVPRKICQQVRWFDKRVWFWWNRHWLGWVVQFVRLYSSTCFSLT